MQAWANRAELIYVLPNKVAYNCLHVLIALPSPASCLDPGHDESEGHRGANSKPTSYKLNRASNSR